MDLEYFLRIISNMNIREEYNLVKNSIILNCQKII